MAFYVYILSNNENTKFLIGFTNNLVKNIHEMKTSQSGALQSQQINKLVYYETHQEYDIAKRREREALGWDDAYTRTIVTLQNARFTDLYSTIF